MTNPAPKGPKRVRIQNIHLVITGFCALVSVGLAAVQTFRADNANPPPVEVKVVAPAPAPAPVAAAAAETVNSAGKSDAPAANVTEVAQEALEASFQSAAVLAEAKFLPATRPDVPGRYALKELFDGNPTTLLTLSPPDTEIDFIIELPFPEGMRISGIEITAPEGIPQNAHPGALDVVVLPDGSMTGSGRDVLSFPLQAGSPLQSFAIAPQPGRALWIRLAGQPGAPVTIIGDIRVLTTVAE